MLSILNGRVRRREEQENKTTRRRKLVALVRTSRKQEDQVLSTFNLSLLLYI